MADSHAFYLIDAGQGRWVVRRSATGEFAGTITRILRGFVLEDANTMHLGVFDSTSEALDGLLWAAA